MFRTGENVATDLATAYRRISKSYVKSNSENYLWGLFYGHAITRTNAKDCAHTSTCILLDEHGVEARTRSHRILNEQKRKNQNSNLKRTYLVDDSVGEHTNRAGHTSFGSTNVECVKKKLRVKIANLCYVIWILFDVSPSSSSPSLFYFSFFAFCPCAVSPTTNTVSIQSSYEINSNNFDGGGGVQIVTDCLKKSQKMENKKPKCNSSYIRWIRGIDAPDPYLSSCNASKFDRDHNLSVERMRCVYAVYRQANPKRVEQIRINDLEFNAQKFIRTKFRSTCAGFRCVGRAEELKYWMRIGWKFLSGLN